MPVLGWAALFQQEKPQYFCGSCQSKWERISGRTCKLCDRPEVEEEVCFDCVRWEQDEKWFGSLKQNLSLVVYNQFCKEVIARFKYRGDYQLSYPLAEMLQEKLDRLNYDFLVPIPLSPERKYERGFNQSEALINALGRQPLSILTRIHSEKQSKKSRNERISLPQVFQLTDSAAIQDKCLVIIDDIYTTGSTLRHAAKLLKESGAKEVTSLTIARG